VKQFSTVVLILLAASSALFAQGQGSWQGFWAAENISGDTFYINVKGQGEASSFWSGPGGDRIERGHWEPYGAGILLTWPSGYRDHLVDTGENVVKYSFGPSATLDDPPLTTTVARRIPPREVGMLTVSGPRDESLIAPQRDRTSPPVRNEFVGYWEVQTGNDEDDRFFMRLDRSGRAEAVQRNFAGDDSPQGSWILDTDRALIKWDNGQRDVLIRDGVGYQLRAFAEGRDTTGEPRRTYPTFQIEASEVSSLFEASTPSELIVEDFLGRWRVAGIGGFGSEFEVERWRQASLYARNVVGKQASRADAGGWSATALP